MIEILLFSLMGISLGIVAGLVPGLHVNTFIPILLSTAFFISDPYALAALIIATAVTQIFVAFIPAIFLGAPDEDTALSVLPGHRLLLEGRAIEAIKLTLVGGLGALATSVGLLLALANLFDDFYSVIRPNLPYILSAIVILMILSERKLKNILYAVLIVSLSGALGFIVLNSSIVPGHNSLFPLLSGLFGLSILLTSIFQNSHLPEQSASDDFKISHGKIFRSFLLGALAGLVVGFMPAVGVSQAASAFQYIGGLNEARTFLVTLSGINVANEIFSLNALYFINNPRSGVGVAIGRIFGSVTFNDVMFFVSVIVFASGIAAIVTLRLGKIIPKLLLKIDYKILSLSTVAFLISAIFLITGIYGVLIGVTAAGIGLLCNYLGVKRSTCMAVLLLPTISFFAGSNPLIVSALSL